MSKVLTVVRKEYLERVKSKSFVIGTLLGPALMSLFIVMPVLLADSGGDDARTIGIIDQAGDVRGRLATALAERGRDNVSLEPFSVGAGGTESAVEELKEAILDGAIDGGMLVSAEFYEDPVVTFYNRSVSAGLVRDEILRPALNTVLRAERFTRSDVPDSLFNYLARRTTWNSVSVSAEGGETAQSEAGVFMVAVSLIMIIYIMVIMYGNHTLTAVIEEKSTRMVEVLLASVSPAKLMLGKVLGIGLAGLTQFTIWAGAFFFASQRGVSVGEFSLDAAMLTPVILICFVVFFLLGFFLYATIYAGVGAMCNSVQDSQQFNMPLTMGLVIPMMLMTLVMRSPDSTVATVLSLVPLFAPVLMFMRVCVETPPLWQIGLSWALMIFSIWLSARAAGKLFRLGILMYGQSPTWASLARALRE